MRKIFIWVLFLFYGRFCDAAVKQAALTLFKADDPKIQYVGRIDFSDPQKPRFWSPGVYITAKFKGTSCEILLTDEELYGNNHNWMEIVVDHLPPRRLKLTGKTNIIKAAENLPEGEHTIVICKNTESGIGYVEFTGIRCQQLMDAPSLPKPKIEYIGDSITCGSAMDLTLPCGSGQWYDQHNAYESYGPVTARALNAQYHISSVSGIGLIHSCCNMPVVMPDVFDRLNLKDEVPKWDFSRYQPDVVTVCLGQNDGVQDSVAYCGAYVRFIGDLRRHYPKADIICLSSPMGDATLNAVLQKYILAINQSARKAGDNKVYHYFFKQSYNNGCGGHPDLQQHQQIAAELTAYLKQLKAGSG